MFRYKTTQKPDGKLSTFVDNCKNMVYHEEKRGGFRIWFMWRDLGMATIYFGKVNLVSEHIYKVYSKELNMRDIMMDILLHFDNGMSFVEENSYIGEDGKEHTNRINYSVYIKEKTDTYIRGRLDKEFKLFFKEKNPITNELEGKSINNTDAIEFYFDVFSEMVGYNTSNRFGHTKFLEIFSEMINQASRRAEKSYLFTVDRYTNGIDIKNLYQELKKINGIQRLSLTLKPVNPTTDILQSIQDNGMDRLEEFEDANLSSKSILLTSSSRLGLNIDSKIVRESLEEVDSLQRDVSAEKAISNGYAKVEATGRDGITRSTADQAPVKRYVKRMSEFVKACEEVIRKRNSVSNKIEE